MNAKKVFISYAHESPKLDNDVFEFSNFLREQGIDSEIDQYEESPAEGWPKWMMRQVQESDFVLIVGSKLYYDRANDFSGSDTGLGAKWETNLILQQLYTNNTNNTKFIPIIFERSEQCHIPLPLQPYTYYDISNNQKKQQLTDRLLGKSISKRPALGSQKEEVRTPEPLPSKERKSLFYTSVVDIELWDKAKWNGTAFIHDPSGNSAPILAFMFTNPKFGEKIFANLKKTFGPSDSNEEIRICFVEDIDPENPRNYKIGLGSNPDTFFRKIEKLGLSSSDTHIASPTRYNLMTPPPGTYNLERFKIDYEDYGSFYLTNLEMKNGNMQPNKKNMIEKKDIHFRKKKDIKENDIDSVMFIEDFKNK